MEKILMRKSYKGSEVFKMVDKTLKEIVQEFSSQINDPYIHAFLILIEAGVKNKLFDKEINNGKN